MIWGPSPSGRCLKKLIGEPIDDEIIVLPVRLIERESCKKT